MGRSDKVDGEVIQAFQDAGRPSIFGRLNGKAALSEKKLPAASMYDKSGAYKNRRQDWLSIMDQLAIVGLTELLKKVDAQDAVNVMMVGLSPQAILDAGVFSSAIPNGVKIVFIDQDAKTIKHVNEALKSKRRESFGRRSSFDLANMSVESYFAQGSNSKFHLIVDANAALVYSPESAKVMKRYHERLVVDGMLLGAFPLRYDRQYKDDCSTSALRDLVRLELATARATHWYVDDANMGQARHLVDFKSDDKTGVSLLKFMDLNDCSSGIRAGIERIAVGYQKLPMSSALKSQNLSRPPV